MYFTGRYIAADDQINVEKNGTEKQGTQKFFIYHGKKMLRC